MGMEIDYKHGLPDDDVKARLDALGEYLSNKHGIKVQWIDATRAKFTGKYLVVKIDGELSMGQNVVRFRGEDPGFLWRKRAVEYIEGKLASYLDAKTQLADLPRK
jgi:hypothetical protein